LHFSVIFSLFHRYKYCMCKCCVKLDLSRWILKSRECHMDNGLWQNMQHNIIWDTCHI